MSRSSFKNISKAWRKLDPFSLRVRLTVGIAAVSALGLGTVAIWTSWQMQQILINSHIQSIVQLAERFPHDVELYSEILPQETGLHHAINNLTTANTLLWVKHPNGTIEFQSATLDVEADPTDAALMSLTEMPLRPQVYEVHGHYFVLYGGLLQVKGKILGKLYVARDITRDQMLFLAMVRGLGLASTLSILAIIAAIALYIERSLQPLRQLSQLAGTISANDLGQARLQLDRAPSEVKELAQMLDFMLSRLSQSWEQQRQFVSDVSHELRTPLTIVHGYLQSVLRRGTNLTEPQREALEIATSEADRIIRLLQDLLDLARADSGNLHFHLENLVLNDIVIEVVGMAEQYDGQRGIKVEASDRAIEVKADRNRLKQILLNLIDNALKYSEPSQAVILKVSQVGEQALVQVRDQGAGIPLQHQSRIFERFYRVDEARARSTGGYGLGLSMVKTLVEGMGGSVAVRSKLGEGSVFTVALPAQASKY